MHLKIGRILFYAELTDLRVTNPVFHTSVQSTHFWYVAYYSKTAFGE